MSIRENFSSKRGDLLYGLWKHRIKLLQKIYPGTQLKDKITSLKDIPIQYIDSMNHAKIERVKNAANYEYSNFCKEYNPSECVDAYIHTMHQHDAISEKFPNPMSKKDLKISINLEREIKDTQNYDKIFLLLPRGYYNIIKRYCNAGIISRHSCGQQSLYTLFTSRIDINSVVIKKQFLFTDKYAFLYWSRVTLCL